MSFFKKIHLYPPLFIQYKLWLLKKIKHKTASLWSSLFSFGVPVKLIINIIIIIIIIIILIILPAFHHDHALSIVVVARLDFFKVQLDHSIVRHRGPVSAQPRSPASSGRTHARSETDPAAGERWTVETYWPSSFFGHIMLT